MRISEPVRVFVIGNAHSTFRARALLDFLSSSSKYSYWYADRRYLYRSARSHVGRLVARLQRSAQRVLNLFHLAAADRVYLLPGADLDLIEEKLIKALRIPLIVDFYVSKWDTEVQDRRRVKQGSSLANDLLKADRRLVDLANTLIFLNQAEQDYYLELLGRTSSNQKALFIPLCGEYRRPAALPYATGRTDKPTLCWWGTFIPLHGLEKIIQAATILRSQGLRFVMYIFGTSEPASKPYQDLAIAQKLEDFVFFDNNKRFYDFTLYTFLLAHCDLAFGTFGESAKARTVMANKVVEAAAMGIPVVSFPTLALSEYFEDGQTIYFAEATPSAIAARIIDILEAPGDVQKVGKRARSLFERSFSREQFTRSVASVLKHPQVHEAKSAARSPLSDSRSECRE